MNEQLLSKKYLVRKLEEKDIPFVLSLCKKNEIYYKYCPPMINEEGVIEDMYALPLNKTMDDKHYVGFFENGKLIAILDLIEKYPDDSTCFIGFFMVDKDVQGKGVGSQIVQDVIKHVKEEGYKYIRLAWVKDNKQSESFWIKNTFDEMGNRKDQTGHSVIEAIKRMV